MEPDNKKPNKILVTHNGSFHTDDVFAAATLSILLEKKGESFKIIRTRNPQVVEEGDYVFDVGGIYDEDGNIFDHHQKGFKVQRENGILYSSFGLVWKKFGAEICEDQKIFDLIDEKLVCPVDAWDNGLDLVENKYKISPYFIQHAFFSMMPTWREREEQGEALLNAMFLKSVAMAREILSREIIQARNALLAEEAVTLAYNNSKDKRIIVLDKNYPAEYILQNFPEPLFVIYPRSNDDTFGVKAVREDPKTFNNRKDFPVPWGGLRDEELVNITGVKEAVFCHKGLFLVVAKTKEGAIQLANLALAS